MTKPNHTPGPWNAHRDENATYCIRSGEAIILKGLSPVNPYSASAEQREADAQLAAAAPQLVEALIDSIKQRAFRFAMTSGKTGKAAWEYAEKSWWLHLSNNEKSALISAGYLNEENE